MVGRKTKLTPELQERIVELIRAGNYAQTACACVGVSERTFYRWLQVKGPLYEEFRQAIKKAESEAEARNLVIIQQAAREQWQAAAWYLERKHRERWSRSPGLGDGGPVQVVVKYVKAEPQKEVHDD